jgi:hypothetical protein
MSSGNYGGLNFDEVKKSNAVPNFIYYGAFYFFILIVYYLVFKQSLVYLTWSYVIQVMDAYVSPSMVTYASVVFR